MQTIGATEVRADFAGLLRRVAFEKQRILVERRGRPRAAVVPIEDLELIEGHGAGGRNEAEDALRETHALFEETERLAKLGHWEWDEVADSCVYCSQELARLHGLTAEDYLRRASSSEADLQWTHPGDRERYNRVVKEAWERRSGFEIEYRLVREDGEILFVREAAEAVLDGDGRLVRSMIGPASTQR